MCVLKSMLTAGSSTTCVMCVGIVQEVRYLKVLTVFESDYNSFYNRINSIDFGIVKSWIIYFCILLISIVARSCNSVGIWSHHLPCYACLKGFLASLGVCFWLLVFQPIHLYCLCIMQIYWRELNSSKVWDFFFYENLLTINLEYSSHTAQKIIFSFKY